MSKYTWIDAIIYWWRYTKTSFHSDDIAIVLALSFSKYIYIYLSKAISVQWKCSCVYMFCCSLLAFFYIYLVLFSLLFFAFTFQNNDFGSHFKEWYSKKKTKKKFTVGQYLSTRWCDKTAHNDIAACTVWYYTVARSFGNNLLNWFLVIEHLASSVICVFGVVYLFLLVYFFVALFSHSLVLFFCFHSQNVYVFWFTKSKVVPSH